MTNPIGPLGPADERFDHQIPDTFATVGTSDPSWTEKVCAMTAKTGRLPPARLRPGQVHQPQRVGRVRRPVPGRRANHRPGQSTALPRTRAHRHRTHPLRGARTHATGAVQPRTQRLPAARLRVDPRGGAAPDHRGAHPSTGSTGVPGLGRTGPVPPDRGGVGLDRARRRTTRDRPDDWVSTRDHSWGVRYDVGTPATDVDPFNPVSAMDFSMIWSPSLMIDPDGTQWGLFMHVIEVEGFGHHRGR